jgi:predicted nucleotidyltransferase
MDKNDAINIAKRYTRYLKTKQSKIRNVFMFGSYCNGKHNENSDIDIAIVMERVADTFSTMLKCMKYRRNIDIRIEPHVFEKSEFNSQNPFALRVINSGVKIL